MCVCVRARDLKYITCVLKIEIGASRLCPGDGSGITNNPPINGPT